MRNIAYKFGTSSASIIMALDVLDYLYEEEKRDYQTSNYSELRTKILEYSSSTADCFSSKFEAVDNQLRQLHVRFYARVTAYLSTISQLEENLEDIFKQLTNYDHIKEDKRDFLKKLIQGRKDEIRKYKVWRDKVFAHLETRDPENIKLEARLQYGGYIKDISKDDCLSLRSNPELKPFLDSDVDIVTLHKTLLQHYDNWEKMFNDYSIE
ncbi:hypothetical protein H6G76_14395 [Nostoc sp. FACHB-152]|uniref:hypothetical protein n=1 Tax=unclassified Nostoc TaxID=2593658 RepID=UPI00168391B2|nr:MULTISPECIES: hypothetical protein [unclassified Nostoc]MBD2448333.1 hypothetical protein [Nostoc sp. FACHB-152]MBD2467495.1 hypothetical protein [Nostoc sp. FACHB-145]